MTDKQRDLAARRVIAKRREVDPGLITILGVFDGWTGEHTFEYHMISASTVLNAKQIHKITLYAKDLKDALGIFWGNEETGIEL